MHTFRATMTSLTVFLVAAPLSAQSPGADPTTAQHRSPVAELLQQPPLAFEPNRGQAEPEAEFVARAAGYRILLTKRGAVLVLGTDRKSWLHIRPVGGNSAPVLTPQDELPGKSNYLDGAAPSTWRVNIPNYARVLYRDVYPGIDLVYRGDDGKLEYDWIVHPGADPGSIQLSFSGGQRIRTDGGELTVGTAAGDVRNRRPVAYQEIGGARRYVEAAYTLGGAKPSQAPAWTLRPRCDAGDRSDDSLPEIPRVLWERPD